MWDLNFAKKHLEQLSTTYEYLLPPIRGAKTVECVRKYMNGILQNLQS